MEQLYLKVYLQTLEHSRQSSINFNLFEIEKNKPNNALTPLKFKLIYAYCSRHIDSIY